MTSFIGGRVDVFVESVLDTLPVTDRVFHDLAHEVPLVKELIARVWALRESGRVLVVGPNALLPEVLLRLGYQVEIWRYPQTILTDRGVDLVGRSGSLESILADDLTANRFDVIVLPYVFEAAREHPSELLARLRQWLTPCGVVITGYRAAGSLHNRLAAFTGKTVPEYRSSDGRAASYGWPPFAARRAFGPTELHEWGMQAGFRVEAQRRVIDRRAAVAIHALSLTAWLRAQASHAAKRFAPSIRDCVVAHLTPYADEERVDVQGREPFVTVILAAGDPARASQALERIAHQTYPTDRVEVVIVSSAAFESLDVPGGLDVRHVRSSPAYGPSAANVALRAAKGEIVAFTDDQCAVPSDWIDVGVGALADWTTAAAGLIQADAGSALPFLVLPGGRPTTPADAWFSSANSFYVRATAIRAGGFDERLASGAGNSVGWDHELARRLTLMGYRTRVEPTLLVRRLFTYPSSRAWVGEEFRRASTLPAAAAGRPGLISPILGLFAAPGTLVFDLVLVGLALSFLAGPLALVLVLPWLAANRRFVPVWPPMRVRTAARNLRGIVLHHVVWLAGLLLGSIRARRLVL